MLVPPLETTDALLAAGVSRPVFDCRWPETRLVAERLWAALPRGLADNTGSGDGQGWRELARTG